MKLLRNARIWLIAMMLAAASAGGAQAQTPDSDNDAKILRCRQNASDLIWMEREKLRVRC